MNANVSLSVDPYSIPLDKLDPSDPILFHRNEHWNYFKRLREEDPVHWVAEGYSGAYWAVTRYQDIVAVDSNHKVFSSRGAISLDIGRLRGTSDDAIPVGGFIAWDPPIHDVHRRIVTPALSPANVAKMQGLIRERTRVVLEQLPVGEEFDFVERVSLELTLLMLATLLDFPVEAKGDLKRWTDAIAGTPGDGVIESWEHRNEMLKEMVGVFLELKAKRLKSPAATDLISMLVHSPAAAEMTDEQYFTNMGLLIVGGNDTTRNSMSGSIIAFDRNRDQWDKLMANPALVESAVPEIIRYHTPIPYQARVATADYELGGKMIRKGDRVAMWYISGNRDGTMIEHADSFIIDRERPRQHLSFGFGIHRCLGNRLAEMQVRILWEEIIRQGWSRIEVTGEPVYAISNVLRGVESLPVRIHA